MKPEQMLKCRIVAAKTQLSAVINALYDLELYHITPHVKGDSNLDIGTPQHGAEELSKILVQIRAILAQFPPVSAPKKLATLTPDAFTKLLASTRRFCSDATVLLSSKNTLQSQRDQLALQKEQLALLSSFKVDLAALLSSKILGVAVGKVARVDEAKAVLATQKSLTIQWKEDILLVIFTKDEESKIRSLLSTVGFTQFNLDDHTQPISQLQKSTEQQLKRIQGEFDTVTQKIKKMHEQLPHLAGLESHLAVEIRKQELPLVFATTQSSFVAEGWVPASQKAAIENSLTKVTKNNIHIEFEKPDHHAQPPVKMKNSRIAKPFESLLELYSLPSYSEIDPTFMLWITFPFFFGFMLGDVGYGAVLAVLFYVLRKKLPASSKPLVTVLLFASIVSIIFGGVFGEVFGFEHVSQETGQSWCDNLGLCLHQETLMEHGESLIVYDFPRLLNRAHSHVTILGFELLTVLVVGAIIGFIHLNLGLLIGTINEWQHHGFVHALEAKISWIILEAGAILAVMSTLHMIPLHYLVGVGVAVIGVVLLAIGEGVQGIVEIPAIISQTLSYMRLGAVGLAGVGLAVVVNEKLALPFIDKGGIFIVIGIVIMLFGHLINLLLGVIGPFLHGVRLHYVEFFSKFYRGGGVAYEPFGKKNEKEGSN
ncbi:V-type ATP synthase subunit I [Candidatus Woesearchaeota archaeon]|nr:V-type ATP synthase subunit I [Candidatus Woesearchaeota archaeon]